MKFLLACGVLIPVLSVSVSASAASEVFVKGYILPAACQISFSNSGVVDYGNVLSADLSNTEITELGDKEATLTIGCDAEAKIGLNVVDELSGTAIDGATVGGVTASAGLYGLGLSGENKIGAYSLHFTKMDVDENSNLDFLLSVGDDSWMVSEDKAILQNVKMSWGGNASPIASKNVTGQIKITAAINKLSELPVQEAIDINGLATFEVVYL